MREAWRSTLAGAGVDVVVYPAPTPVALQAGVPFVVAIHDLQHRMQPEFEEVTAGGEAERRDVLFGALAEHALVVLADSEVGCEDILRFYGDRIAAPRVAALPFVALARFDNVGAADVRSRPGAARAEDALPLLPRPALAAQEPCADRRGGCPPAGGGSSVTVAFTGSPAPGPRAAVHRDLRRRADELGIEDAVRLLGELPGEDVAPLYAGAVALVMPTFFGPTNIPVLEAWAVGCPVITSDIRGIREQAGDAAVLVDPRSTESIAEGMATVWRDEELRRRLAEAGHARLATWDRAAFAKRLEEVLMRAAVGTGRARTLLVSSNAWRSSGSRPRRNSGPTRATDAARSLLAAEAVSRSRGSDPAKRAPLVGGAAGVRRSCSSSVVRTAPPRRQRQSARATFPRWRATSVGRRSSATSSTAPSARPKPRRSATRMRTSSSSTSSQVWRTPLRSGESRSSSSASA